LVWLKRLAVVVVLAASFGGYHLWSRAQIARRAEEAKKYALVTALVWVESARLRNDPTRFVVWRDSLLAANGLSKETMTEYVNIYKDRSEDYIVFAQMVHHCVDSIYWLTSRPAEKEHWSLPDTLRHGS
jgi:hypothetical protein